MSRRYDVTSFASSRGPSRFRKVTKPVSSVLPRFSRRFRSTSEGESGVSRKVKPLRFPRRGSAVNAAHFGLRGAVTAPSTATGAPSFTRAGPGTAAHPRHRRQLRDVARAHPDAGRDHTVIAPDLLGHGRSDKPRADYSVAAYANGMRDLLTRARDRARHGRRPLARRRRRDAVRLSVPRALRAPGAGEQRRRLARGAPACCAWPRRPTPTCSCRSCACARAARRDARRARCSSGSAPTSAATPTICCACSTRCPTRTARRAFVRTLRAVVDWRGQVITMLDRCYLTRGMPTLLVWGDARRGDPVRPRAARARGHARQPARGRSTGAGHFPHHNEPERFVAVLDDFLATTPPASYHTEEWRALLQRGKTVLPGADVRALPAPRAGTAWIDSIRSAGKRG